MTDHRRIILCSEWFPPALGGSAELLANTYSRVATSVEVVTTNARSGAWQQQGHDVPVHRVTFPDGLGLLDVRSGRRTWNLSRTLRKVGGAQAVVHCGRVLPEGTAAMLSGQWSGSPFICWTHGEELPIVDASRELRWLARRVHRSAAAIVANSQHTADLVAALGHGPKVHVVRPAVDPDRFRPGQRRAEVRHRLARGADVVLLAVGRLQARKGHDLTLKALARMKSAETFRYVIVGEGPEAPSLRALAAELGVADRVTFEGAVDAGDLPSYYAAADIFVHPNRVEGGDFEGFGIVFLEAAASGIPSIGGRSGGVPESVEEDVTGLLVDGADPDELRAALEQLAAAPERRASMGAAGRARVLREFTWERAARQIDTLDRAIRSR